MWKIAGKTAVETAVTPDTNAKNNVKIRRERKVSSISNIPFSLDSKSVISPPSRNIACIELETVAGFDGTHLGDGAVCQNDYGAG
jgi:hypothetical protein